jgi:hypothetical protein
MAKPRQTLTFHFQAKSDRLERDLRLANRKLEGFKNRTKLNMDSIRNSFAGAFGGFIVLNAVTNVVKGLASFELQMDKVHAISGATSKQMEELTKNALELGRTSVFTSTEIGKMQEELARLGFTSSQILAASKAISQLALVTDTELGEAAKVMAQTLNGYNLEAEESRRVSNVMAESFAKSALNMEKFSIATSNSSAVSRLFGATIEENTSRLAKLVDSGIDASKAGTDLRRIYTDLNAAGLTWDEGMQKIATSQNKISTATDLFGRRSAAAGAILSNLQDEVKLLTEELADQNRELLKQAKIMASNVSTEWKLLTSAMDGTAKKGTVFNEVIATEVSNLRKMVEVINDDSIPALSKLANTFLLFGSMSGFLLQRASLENLDKKLDDATKKNLARGRAMTQASAIFAFAENKKLGGLKEMLTWVQKGQDVDLITIELKKLIAQATEDENKEIARQSKLYDENTVAQYKNLRAMAGAKSAAIDAIQNSSGAKEEDARKRGTFAGLNTSIFDGGVANEDIAGGAAEAYAKSLEKQAKDQKKYVEATRAQVADLNRIVTDSIANGIGTFVETLASGGGIEKAFAGLLGVIGGGLVGLGKTLIAYGISLEAFKKALANPFAAIAAGTAAVAIGSIFKSQASALAGSVGGGGGGSTGPRGSFTGGATGQSIGVEGEFRIKGDDLVYVLDRQQRGRSRTG